MENLTKHQIVLLTLLVSFVTSMATGIVAVSLMSQAPAGVTQTINRVVERTIEKVVQPSSTSTSQQIVKETVVVSSDDQVVGAVEKNSKNLVRIYRTNIDPSLGLGSMTFVGIGVVVDETGIIATDETIITSEGGKYFSPDENDKLREIKILRSVSGEQIALLKINFDKDVTKSVVSENDAKLGQSVVYIGGEKSDIVSTGIISSLGKVTVSENASSTVQKISNIETSLSQNLVSGGVLLNLSGEIVGIKSTYINSSKNNLFAPSSEISKALSLWRASEKKTE